MRSTRSRLLAGTAAAVTALVLTCASAAFAAGPVVVSPIVAHTGATNTGYTVTFNYYAPTATSVRIRGEWFFSSVAGTTTSTSLGLLPSQWMGGDFAIANPNNGPAANWPVANMTENTSTGVWTYTTPMPPGTFTYGFYVNCTAAAPALTGCTELPDPSNLPWNDVNGVSTGSVEPDSEVWVPADPNFGGTTIPGRTDVGATNYAAWQEPAAQEGIAAGTLSDVSYPTTLSTSPIGSHPLAVYLPPGYNASRNPPYPLLILSHGAGGNEVDWSTQGAANSILDNLIDGDQMQPVVVAMTDFNNLSGSLAGYATDVITNVVPFMEANYNVAHTPNDMAFGGLSAGGQRANQILYNNTTSFGYYGVWSNAGGFPTANSPLYDTAALRSLLGLQIGAGSDDNLTPTNTNVEDADLTTSGIPFVSDQFPAGHEWYTWRILLHDFASQIAFKTTHLNLAASTSAGNSTFTATVVPATNEPVAPTGSVQFYAGSPQNAAHQIGSAVAVGATNEQAAVTIPTASYTQAISAVYSGDQYYTTGSAALTPVTTATIAPATVNGYYNQNPTVTLSASAAAGGFPVASTSYLLDSGATNTYSTPFQITGDGEHTLTYYSTDTSGGQETPHKISITIDTTPPVTTATTSPVLVNGAVATAGSVRVTLTRTDATSGVASTTYTIDGGGPLTYTSAFNVSGGGLHTITYYSTDNAGNVEATHTLTIQINPTATSAPAATVASTLSVSVGATAPNFGTFSPGASVTYMSTVPLTVTSTAASAMLTAADACTPTATCFPGYLVNTSAVGGPYKLAQGLQVDATSSSAAASGAGTYTNLSVTNPATILTYTAPVSNDVVTVGFQQPIGPTDPLRTGTYSKTITLTLSTTTP